MKPSYFGEMLGIHSGPELMPRRPASSLWKVARLERIAAERTPPPPRAITTQSAPASAPPEIIPTPVPAELTQPISVRTPDQPAQRNHEQISAMRPRAEKSAPPVNRAALPEQHSRQPASHPGQRGLHAAAAPDAPLPPSTPLGLGANRENPAELTPGFPARETRSQLPPRDLAPRITDQSQTTPRPQEPNAIHVGRIEVQVVSPLLTRSSIPQRPGRLARGYMLCFGAWQP